MLRWLAAFSITFTAVLAVGEVIIFGDGLRTPARAFGSYQVYSDGVLVVLGDGGAPSDPNEIPQYDFLAFYYPEQTNGVEVMDAGPVGTNYAGVSGLSPDHYETSSTTYKSRFAYTGAGNEAITPHTSDIMSQISTDQVGTIFLRFRDDDGDAQNALLWAGINTSDTFMWLIADTRSSTEELRMRFNVDGTNVFAAETTGDFLADISNSDNSVALVQENDGNGVKAYFNGLPVALSTTALVRADVWWDDLVDTATDKADKMRFGQFQGGVAPHTGPIFDMSLHRVALSDAEILEWHNSTATNNGLPSYALNDPQRDS